VGELFIKGIKHFWMECVMRYKKQKKKYNQEGKYTSKMNSEMFFGTIYAFSAHFKMNEGLRLRKFLKGAIRNFLRGSIRMDLTVEIGNKSKTLKKQNLRRNI
jgi:hypothetical protein